VSGVEKTAIFYFHDEAAWIGRVKKAMASVD
jgi:hypothetical protein